MKDDVILVNLPTQKTKDAQQYEANQQKLLALLGADLLKKGNKIPNDDIGDIVEELVRDKRESAVKVFKDKALKFLEKKVEFEDKVVKLRKEFDNQVNEQIKIQNQEMQELFRLVENIQALTERYMQAFAVTSNSTPIELDGE